jgi:hypothetical protein
MIAARIRSFLYITCTFSVAEIASQPQAHDLRGYSDERLNGYEAEPKENDVEELHALLAPMYDALPKDNKGLIHAEVARYALHRVFMEWRGWFVYGLMEEQLANFTYASGRSARPFSARRSHLAEDIRSYVTQAVGAGTDMRGLATIGAKVASSTHEDEVQRLLQAYDFIGFDPYVAVNGTEVDEVVHAYMLMYLYGTMEDLQLSVTDREGVLEMRKALMEDKAASWINVEKFLNNTLRTSMAALQPGLLGGEKVDFEAVSEIIADVDGKYAAWVGSLCHGLKWALLSKESTQLGRIDLADFYRLGRDGDWKLTEKVGYLREIGALDESGDVPRVIVPNYMGALTNCHHVSPFYSLCCRNECDDLMTKIETNVGEPTTTPERVAAVVKSIGSDTIEASRRALPPKLMRRLYDVTHEGVGGRVPLHGRLFMQWMHHAFPNECPYPHARGTWSYRCPEEWSEENGHESVSASDEEMDTVCNTGNNGNGEVPREIPWNDQEELLAHLGHYHKSEQPSIPASSDLLFSQQYILPVSSLLAMSAMLMALRKAYKKLHPDKVAFTDQMA